MKKRKIVFLILLFLAMIVFFNTKSFAKSQKLNQLDFDVTLDSSGNMNVVETWDVDLYDTNTLFKTFENIPTGITNVLVTEVTNGTNQEYTDVKQLQYHVDKGGYYGLKNKSGDFEIAWNVDSDGKRTNKQYKISYTVSNIVQIYNDCAELYWQFIGDDFSIDAKNITGTIKLPSLVENIEEFRVWAHGPLTGEILKTSNDVAEFTLPRLDATTMLEVRIATPASTFPNATQKHNSNMLESIINEETNWANDANRTRQRAKKAVSDAKKPIYVAISIISLISIIGIIKGKKILDNYPKLIPSQELDYFRNIPDETATPAEAQFLYKFGKKFDTGKVFSATLLDLALKKLIDFEMLDGNKKNVRVIIQNKPEVLLEKDEMAIFDFIKRAAGINGSISIKEFEKYCQKNDNASYLLWNNISKLAKKANVQKGKYDPSIARKGSSYGIFGGILVITTLISLIFLMATKVALIGTVFGLIGTITLAIAASRLKGLTQKGIDEKERWEGLKQFMLDFSLLDEKRVPDLPLWEKYLVYATAFGIADEVLKQLRVYFPQLQDDVYFREYYSSIYYCNHYNIGRSFEKSIYSGYSARVAEIASSRMAEIASSSMSSGSGGGGGFSSGGGGRFRRRRRRRSLK